MTIDIVTGIVSSAILKILVLSLPSIGLGLLIGFSVSLFQALTQIQEQTLTFVPKMVVILMMIGVTMGWMLSQLVAFSVGLWSMIPQLVGG